MLHIRPHSSVEAVRFERGSRFEDAEQFDARLRHNKPASGKDAVQNTRKLCYVHEKQRRIRN